MLKQLLLLFIVTNFLLAEDVMIGHQYKDDNFYLPPVPKSMSFEEFDLLSQQVGFKEMLYSLVVPGYMHYKAQEPTAAYTLATIRLASYTTLGYLSLNSTTYTQNDPFTHAILNTAIATAVLSYLYDYIIGENILEYKQNRLRYHYSIGTTTQKNGAINTSVQFNANF